MSENSQDYAQKPQLYVHEFGFGLHFTKVKQLLTTPLSGITNKISVQVHISDRGLIFRRKKFHGNYKTTWTVPCREQTFKDGCRSSFFFQDNFYTS